MSCIRSPERIHPTLPNGLSCLQARTLAALQTMQDKGTDTQSPSQQGGVGSTTCQVSTSHRKICYARAMESPDKLGMVTMPQTKQNKTLQYTRWPKLPVQGMKWHLNSTPEPQQAPNIGSCSQDTQTKIHKNHASCQVCKNAPAHTSSSDIMTLDASPSSSQGELGGLLDGRGDKT